MRIKFETRAGEHDIAADDRESLLFNGLGQGLTLPYECATGTCGTCRGRVMSGEVSIAWDAAPGFSKIKRDKGDVLMCQARAKGDCVVRVASEVVVTPSVRPRRHSGVIEEARLLTHDVMHFAVRLEQAMPFIAGQFAVLDFPGLVGGRAYSMVDFAPRSNLITFVVKKKPGGGASNWLFSQNVVGSRIELFGALGRATYQPEDARDLVVIAGGSGIAGMMAILDCAVTAGHFGRHSGRVFFGVRTLADGLYLEELSRFVQAAGKALEVTLVLSDEAPSGDRHPAFSAIRLETGFVHDAAGRALAAGAPNALAFVAGPPPMVDGAIRTLITTAKVPPSSIRYDKFG